MKYPALVLPEAEGLYANVSEEQEGYLGVITNIRVQENGVKIHWKKIRNIPMKKIVSMSFELSLMDMERAVLEINHTHWAVKQINLIEELLENGVLI